MSCSVKVAPKTVPVGLLWLMWTLLGVYSLQQDACHDSCLLNCIIVQVALEKSTGLRLTLNNKF